MKRFVWLLAFALGAGFCPAAAQEGSKDRNQNTRREDKARIDEGATFGKIKEVEKGQKIVIAVDNAPDKSYNLGDAKRTITIAEGLAVGDAVKVMETDKDGVKSVQIVRDVRAGEQERSRRKEGGQK